MTTDEAEVRRRVREFVVESFTYRAGGQPLADDTDLVKENIIDSAAILVLVHFLEDSFEVTIADDEVEPENLGSIDAIAALIARKTGGG